MDNNEPSSIDPVVDAALGHTRAYELVSGHHTVLSYRQLRDHSVVTVHSVQGYQRTMTKISTTPSRLPAPNVLATELTSFHYTRV